MNMFDIPLIILYGCELICLYFIKEIYFDYKAGKAPFIGAIFVGGIYLIMFILILLLIYFGLRKH